MEPSDGSDQLGNWFIRKDSNDVQNTNKIQMQDDPFATTPGQGALNDYLMEYLNAPSEMSNMDFGPSPKIDMEQKSPVFSFA